MKFSFSSELCICKALELTSVPVNHRRELCGEGPGLGRIGFGEHGQES